MILTECCCHIQRENAGRKRWFVNTRGSRYQCHKCIFNNCGCFACVDSGNYFLLFIQRILCWPWFFCACFRCAWFILYSFFTCTPCRFERMRTRTRILDDIHNRIAPKTISIKSSSDRTVDHIDNYPYDASLPCVCCFTCWLDRCCTCDLEFDHDDIDDFGLYVGPGSCCKSSGVNLSHAQHGGDAALLAKMPTRESKIPIRDVEEQDPDSRV
jgi:hypothetical protein